MSLPRKDVRVKLDFDMHEAMVICAELDGIGLERWCEKTVCDAVRRRVHAANVLAKRSKELKISGIGGDHEFLSSESAS